MTKTSDSRWPIFSIGATGKSRCLRAESYARAQHSGAVQLFVLSAPLHSNQLRSAGAPARLPSVQTKACCAARRRFIAAAASASGLGDRRRTFETAGFLLRGPVSHSWTVVISCLPPRPDAVFP